MYLLFIIDVIKHLNLCMYKKSIEFYRSHCYCYNVCILSLSLHLYSYAPWSQAKKWASSHRRNPATKWVYKLVPEFVS